MESIIVTVTNISKAYLYDLEVPTNITIDKLKDDIVEALNGYNPDLFLRTATTELFCNRIGRQLKADETLENAGVWNGDYITIIEV
ncbi:EsaB/YukD family protein [Anaeromassilibacillus sp. 1001302B_160321_C8]|uniref:EsaB/YukD family protein n=1 Tax=Anaeromassilibacillus sp. 1001302B_160321_C8 TaxID=2787132 RepID=UPI0018987AFB